MNSNPFYDVVIVGGGIHGAGVAQASAAQGYSVLLLEQNSIGSGTSNKSSKLIHGGLRYLESGQFSLVRECLNERHYLLKNAPHLVELKPFYLPIYKQTSRRPLQIQMGLSLYALLAGLRKKSFFHRVSKNNWNQLDGLSLQNLQSVFQYWDAQTDDQLLTKAVLSSAKEMGAEAIEHAELICAENNDGEWQINFKTEQHQAEVRSKVVVNAGGPWVNEVLKRLTPNDAGMPVDLVQGTHIVLAEETSQGIYYVESPEDRRAVFVMPWYGETLVGTTEKIYTGDPANVSPTSEEENYLLNTASHYFPKFKHTDIQRSFAGLRVLPQQQGAAFSRPRETTIYKDKTNSCLSIYGGKLTAYRATSANVVKQFNHLLPNRRFVADTRYLKLPE
ncbi:MAG: glycerol-3-phosphate dehydrogenase/oxidase [Gammaproteobacteria bacterium]|nr:glycerol-3-phosphate dehydrogenase/oxidase [Gammaproteobacteria bacterium]